MATCVDTVRWGLISSELVRFIYAVDESEPLSLDEREAIHGLGLFAHAIFPEILAALKAKEKEELSNAQTS